MTCRSLDQAGFLVVRGTSRRLSPRLSRFRERSLSCHSSERRTGGRGAAGGADRTRRAAAVEIEREEQRLRGSNEMSSGCMDRARETGSTDRAMGSTAARIERQERRWCRSSEGEASVSCGRGRCDRRATRHSAWFHRFGATSA